MENCTKLLITTFKKLLLARMRTKNVKPNKDEKKSNIIFEIMYQEQQQKTFSNMLSGI